MSIIAPFSHPMYVMAKAVGASCNLACRICNGECPRNRFVKDRYGNPGLNYLCVGYHKFFEHSAPYFEFMKQELDNNRAPANVMSQLF